MSNQLHLEDVTDEPEDFTADQENDEIIEDEHVPSSRAAGVPDIASTQIEYKLNEETEVPGSNGKLFKTVLKASENPKAKYPTTGSTVSVWYCGRLGPNATDAKFDSARDRNEPFEFQLGGGVITGWNVGVATMKVGERALFKITHEWAYGEAGSPPRIPGRATLYFDIELLSFNRRTDDVSRTRDKSVTKNGVLVKGNSSELPTYESKVVFDLQVFKGLIDFEDLEDEETKNSKPDIEKKEWTFEVGDVDLPSQLEDAIGSLKRGETSFFHVRGRHASSAYEEIYKLLNDNREIKNEMDVPVVFTMKIAMKEFDVKQTWGYKDMHKIEQAVQRKDQGNAYFKAKQFGKAVKKYERALSFVENDYGLDGDEAKAKAEELLVALRGNIAQVHLLMNNLNAAVDQCNKILEVQPGNSKALFRKAKALNMQQEFDDAEKLLRQILVSEPNNADVAAELANVVAKKKAFNDKQKKLYSNMFG